MRDNGVSVADLSGLEAAPGCASMTREEAIEAAGALWRKHGRPGMPFIACTTLVGEPRYVAGWIEIGPAGGK